MTKFLTYFILFYHLNTGQKILHVTLNVVTDAENEDNSKKKPIYLISRKNFFD